eukprot:4669814-Pyramimonas_sp.AAC.1
MGSKIAPHRRCIADESADASATSPWKNSGSASSRIVDASAMRGDPPTRSTPTTSRRPRAKRLE